MTSATRCVPASGPTRCATAVPTSGCAPSGRSAGRGDGGRGGGRVHDLQPGPLLLAPPRARAHGPPGGGGAAGARSRRVRENLAAVREQVGPGSRSWPPPSTWRPTTCPRWRRPASPWWARTAATPWRPSRTLLRRPLHVGLHRPPAEPQGARRGGPGAADPRRSTRSRRRSSSEPRARAGRLPAAGEHRRRGSQGGVEPEGVDRFLAAVAELGRCSLRGLMTMPPLTERPRERPALVRAAARAARPARAAVVGPARADPAVDGHQPGLSRRRRRGRDDRAGGQRPVRKVECVCVMALRDMWNRTRSTSAIREEDWEDETTTTTVPPPMRTSSAGTGSGPTSAG